jgi:single-strand DNA-binding protein
MKDTVVTVIGNVASGPMYHETQAGNPAARFRIAVTARRFDSERGSWEHAHTSFYTVWAWRALASNVVASVAMGEPVVVHGRLRVREFEREGHKCYEATIDAMSVGHDLTLGTSAFRKVARAKPELIGEQEPLAPGAAPAPAGAAG